MKKETYQIFISFKNTYEDIKTRDYELAERLYKTLKSDYKVFFSPVTLEKEGLSDWDSEIEIALEESIVFIMVGTEREYIESKNLVRERAVYLSLMKKDSNKTYYNYISPPLTIDTLPHDIGTRQTFTHENSDNGIDRLCSFIKNHSTRIEKLEKNVHKNRQQIEDQNVEINNLKKQIGTEKKLFNWKKLLLLFSISLIFGLLYFGYKNFYQHKATLHSPIAIPSLLVSVKHNGIKSEFSKNVIVNDGDRLSFQLHAYAGHLSIENLKYQLDNLRYKTFKPNSNLKVSSVISADNVEPLRGSVTLNFTDSVKLKYYGYSLRIQNTKNNTQEIKETLPDSQNGATVMGEGAIVPFLKKDYRSNLLLFFDVVGKGS